MTHSPRALAHIRVLDLSRILAGPYCAMLLADYGADVIKIELPGSGDGTRQWGPPWVGDQSAYFLTANRNKRSLTLNFKTAAGKEILKKLTLEADVLIENFRPGTMARLGLGYETLSAINPGLVFCSISGYGQDGPYRDRAGYDFMMQAQGGIMSITGPVEGLPQKVPVAITDITTALYACTAILAALQARGHTGRGQLVDVSLLDSQVAWLINVAQNYFATGENPLRYGNAHPNLVPYETLPTADGDIALAIGSNEQYERMCRLADRPDLWDDERFQTNAGRVAHRQELISKLQELFRTRTSTAWFELLTQAVIPCSPINDIPTVLNDPQVLHRGMVQEVEHATAGPIKLLGPVAKLSGTPATVYKAPPTLGDANMAILVEELGYSQTEFDAFLADGVI